LKGGKDLGFFRGGKFLGGDDSDLLFLVELLIKFNITGGNSSDVSKSLVFSEDLKELNSKWMEVSNLLKTLVECFNLRNTNTSVLGEQLE